MATRVTEVLLCIATVLHSQKSPHEQSVVTRNGKNLTDQRLCKVTVGEERLHALCNVTPTGLIEDFSPDWLFYIGRRIELHLVSETSIVNITSEEEPVCLYLHKFRVDGNEVYPRDNYSCSPERYEFGIPAFCDRILEIRDSILRKTLFFTAPSAAAAICRKTSPDGSCLFEVYGSLRSSYNSTFSKDLKEFCKHGDIDYSLTDEVNITALRTPKILPDDLLALASVAPVKKILFSGWGTNRRLGYNKLLVMKRTEHLEFMTIPLQDVASVAFQQIPHLKHISLVGTRLSGIPEAIFTLRHLDTLNMSHTDPISDAYFDFCPEKRSQNSTATRLILSGSKLTALPSRAFCAFPMLEKLALDGCHLPDISGSPFECLRRLKNLSMFGNHIVSLYGRNVKGLESLVSLDVSNNHIAYFQGSYILSTLISLRTLFIANNQLGKLDLYSRGKLLIEELNLDGNNIKLWQPPLFNHMRQLKKLSFAHNELAQWDDKMFDDIQHIDDLDFSSNPWDCLSCHLDNLHSLLQRHPPKCSDCFTCATPLGLYKYDVRNVSWREDDCGPPDYYRIYVVPGLLSFMVATVLVNIAYRKRWYITYALLYLRVTIKGYRRQRHVGSFFMGRLCVIPRLGRRVGS
ncbi:hypothetical protein MTO96_036982 [Rhipicephalus appendiculatus]